MEDSAGFSTRFAVLDGVRAIAILLVVFPHVQLTQTLPGPDIVQRLVHDFGHGVDVFFVLSGFCVALPLLIELRESGKATLNLSAFFFNRAFRVIPLFYLSIVVCTLLVIFYHDTWGALPPTISFPESAWAWAKQFLLVDQSVTPVDSNFWSIPVQLHWYVMFPVFMALYVRSRGAFFVALLAAAVAHRVMPTHPLELGTLPLFMLGIVAADLTVNEHRLRRLGLPLIVVGLILGHIADRHESWTMQPNTFGWQIAAFGFVLAATNERLLRGALSCRPLVALGGISFSIYLIHQPLVEIVAAALKGRSGLVGVAVSLAAGCAFWFVGERFFGSSPFRTRARGRVVACVDRLAGRFATSCRLTFHSAASGVRSR